MMSELECRWQQVFRPQLDLGLRKWRYHPAQKKYVSATDGDRRVGPPRLQQDGTFEVASEGMAGSLLLVCLLVLGSVLSAAPVPLDPAGYVVYCPCMGRFGNQADHFLGALSFSKGLNRTLILPPWVEYHPGEKYSQQIAFDTYFRVSGLLEFHRVITMEHFMEEFAEQIWPPEERIAFCYSSRPGGSQDDCNAKDGNPFGPFWDTHKIDFVKSEFYGPLPFKTQYSSNAHQWNKRFPADQYPVLAFTGAPATFPVAEEDTHLHKYLKWSALITNEAEKFINERINRPFLSIHMRNGVDWRRTCEHAKESERHLFASPQCLGYNMEYGKVTEQMCFPSEESILKQVKKAVKRIHAQTVFVASDNDHMLDQIKKRLKKLETKVVKLHFKEPHVDLAVAAQADHYIGNCISTFSAFITRERRVNGKSVEFWGHKGLPHDEL